MDEAGMTAGLVAFGVGLYAPVLRTRLPGGASKAATLTAAATLAVAALPLGGTGGEKGHAAAAAVAYAALAAIPLLAARTHASLGERRMAVVSTAASVAIALALGCSVILPHHDGAAQRLGLTLGDLWIMSSALATRPVSRSSRGWSGEGRRCGA